MRRIGERLASRAGWLWAIGAIGAMMLAVMVGGVFWTSLLTESARQDIEEARSRSLEAIISANAVESSVVDRQRMARGFLIRGGVGDAEPDPEVVKDRMERLAMLLRTDRNQQRRVAELRRLADEQEQRVADIRTRFYGGESPKSILSDGTRTGDDAIRDVRKVVDSIVATERARLIELRMRSGYVMREAENYIYAIGILCLMVVMLGGTAVTISLRSTWRLRIREMEKLNEERMRIAHEATGAGTWEYFPGERALLWSPEMSLLYGRDPAEGAPTPEQWAEIVHEEDRDACPWTAGFDGAASFAVTFRIATPSGAYRWIASRGFSFLRDGRNRVVGLDVDVTEQVANREELGRLNMLLSAEAAADRRDRELVFEAAGDMIAVVSSEGVILSANPAWCRVLGGSCSEVVGRSIESFMPAGTKWRPDALSSKLVRADGAVRTIEWTAAMDERGRWIVAGRDVTEQQEAEARLRETEETLRQIQKMESVGEMTGGVAHDFNNMLTPIIGFLDILSKRHSEDPKSVRMIGAAMESAEKAKILVSKLLSFARRQQLEYRVIDAGGLVGGMVELISKSVTRPGVEMDVSLPDESACVKVDPNQFEMVLMNLAVNARDAVPQGGRIGIAVRRADGSEAPRGSGVGAGRHVVVSVSDDGVGMDADTLRRAVEPFYSTKGLGKGTGLGLSMAHGVAGQSGGALVLESEPGVGTTASIWLPEMDAALATSSGEGRLEERPQVSRRLKILLVDDDEIVRRSIEAMLAEVGHEVRSVSSGSEALSLIGTSDGFDVMVTDYLMPTMTGGELVKRVREIHPDLPALVVSGYTKLRAEEDLGGVMRIAKPFTTAKLLQAIDRVVPAVEAGTGNVVQLRAKS